MSAADETTALPLTAEQEAWYRAARAKLDAGRLKRLLMELVNIHSPTGGERAASEFMARYLADQAGLEARYQPIGDLTGNAAAELRGTGGGARLLLYAPIDTHVDPESDVPFAARKLRADMLPQASSRGDLVIGLGAGNPKCMVAALAEVAHAVRDAGLPLKGDLALGFAGGGMPAFAPARGNFGLGAGIHHLLSHGMAPDFAIIMKPGSHIYAEEAGLCWFKVTVDVGTLGYAGVARGTPGYRSAILPLATLLQDFEDWIAAYTERNSAGGVIAEGWITGVHAGWPEKAAFPPAVSEIFLDLRVNPRSSPAEVRAQFAAAFAGMAARRPDVTLDWEMYASLPGGMTDPGNWIIQSARRGWERLNGRKHGTPPPIGGQTDGALIRRLGIPCARVGYPWPPEAMPREFADGIGGMGVASVKDVMRAAEIILYSVVDTLSRPRSELGL